MIARTATKTPGCLARGLFAGCTLLAWAVVAFAALELYARWELKRDEAAALAYCEPLVEAAFARDYAEIAATAESAPKPPEALVRPLPSRALVQGADDAARLALARERRELIFEVDKTGSIGTLHTGNNQPEAVALAARIRAAGNLSGLLPEAEARDAMAALGEALGGATPPPREYSVPLGDEGAYVSEWTFDPQPDGSVLAFVRDSFWQDLWIRFRGNVYGNNFYDRWKDSEFWTNARGHRDDPVAMPKPEGVFRVACVGGSTTVEGPRNDLTYPNMVERELRENLKSDAIEVINCGVYTVDTGRTVQRLPEILALDPDIVVQYNFVNDVASQMPGWIAPRGLFRTPVKWIKSKLRASVFAHRHANLWLLPSRAELRKAINGSVINNLRTMLALANDAGVPMAFASFAAPGGENLDNVQADFFYLHSNRLWGWSVDTRSYVYLVGIYNELLREFCEETGSLYLPVAENVTGGLESFTDICHMHLDAMRKKAGVVADGLQPLAAAKLERAQ